MQRSCSPQIVNEENQHLQHSATKVPLKSKKAAIGYSKMSTIKMSKIMMKSESLPSLFERNNQPKEEDDDDVVVVSNDLAEE